MTAFWCAASLGLQAGEDVKYTVCALTGAWFEDGALEMSSTCGHRHKTLATAQRCLAKLTDTTCDHGIRAGGRCSLCTGGRALPQNTAAKWYNAVICDSAGMPVQEGL